MYLFLVLLLAIIIFLLLKINSKLSKKDTDRTQEVINRYEAELRKKDRSSR